MSNNITEEYLEDLRSISYDVGIRKELIQATGGNTSCKIENLIWVKASGKSLLNANNENIFIALEIDKIKNILNTEKNEDITFPLARQSNLRASMETGMHALMPHKYVVHTHPIDVIAHTVVKDGDKKLSVLLKDFNWAWVPYKKPGSILAREISNILKEKQPDILILANHGLVVGSDNIKSLNTLQESVLNKLSLIPKVFAEISLNKLNKYVLLLNENGFAAKLPQNKYVHLLAKDNWSFRIANLNPLYPDHLVFCGTKPNILPSNVSNKILFSAAASTKYCLIKDEGVIIFGSKNRAIEDMLEAQAQVHMRIPIDSEINTLTNFDCEQLINCQSEIYRVSLQNAL